MSNQEFKFLFRNVMRSPHMTLSECKLDDELAHLYATDYDAYKKTVMNQSNGDAIVHV